MINAKKFNNSTFGRWINSRVGRVFRLCAGAIFLVLGIIFIDNSWGKASLLWSFFPLTAGIFNVCWISLVLGGPFSGKKICEQQKT